MGQHRKPKTPVKLRQPSKSPKPVARTKTVTPARAKEQAPLSDKVYLLDEIINDPERAKQSFEVLPADPDTARLEAEAQERQVQPPGGRVGQREEQEADGGDREVSAPGSSA